jgi:hypothetical protein
MALLHHETIIPAVTAVWPVYAFWVAASIGAAIHWLKHLYIWLRYGSEIDTTLRAPDDCEVCGMIEPLRLYDHTNATGFLNQQFLCDNCGEGLKAILAGKSA